MTQQVLRDRRGRQVLWLSLLVAASVAFSLGLACAVPLAAFAAAGALTLNRRDALLLIAAVWLANQLVGFLYLAYPWTASTFVWGAVLGVVAVLATLAGQAVVGQAVVGQAGRAGAAVVAAAAFLGAFVVYEGGLFVVSATLLGGTEDYAPAIVARIFEINVLAFAGLLVLHRLGTMIGLAAQPGTRLIPAARHT